MSEHRVPNLNWLWQDFRFGLRTLRKDFRFASLAILALALGIGATTVIFSAIDAILLEPYPYKDADRLTHFFIHDVTRPLEDGRGSIFCPEFMDFREAKQRVRGHDWLQCHGRSLFPGRRSRTIRWLLGDRKYF